MRRTSRRSLVILIIIIAMIIPISTAAAATLTQDLAELGFSTPRERLPSIDFTLQTTDQQTRSLSDYRGKVVFLNFWATWCGPCRAEMPSMQLLYEELQDEGFEIVAVNLGERPAPVNTFINEYGLTFPVLLDQRQTVGTQYGARSIPTTFLIDRNGDILGMAVGSREWDTPEYIELFRKVLAL